MSCHEELKQNKTHSQQRLLKQQVSGQKFCMARAGALRRWFNATHPPQATNIKGPHYILKHFTSQSHKLVYVVTLVGAKEVSNGCSESGRKSEMNFH